MYKIIRYLKLKIKFFLIKKQKKIILSRTACLFNDTIQLLEHKHIPRYNVQKGRIDMWLDYFNKEFVKPKVALSKYILRNDIVDLFLEQSLFNLKNRINPYMLVMDSYSELVDRKYISKNNSNEYFFACSEDLKNNFEEKLQDNGLMPIEDIFVKYDLFFKLFKQKFPSCPIVFILVPSKLEQRDFYIYRSNEIKSAIKKISKKYMDFHVVEIPETLISYNPNDNFPYHYSNNVYDYLAQYFSTKKLFLNIIK